MIRGSTWLDDRFEEHAPVGRLRANPFGLHHVSGNITELCRDRYGVYLTEARARYAVCRGGHRGEQSATARSAYRTGHTSYERNGAFGLRPARTLDPLTLRSVRGTPEKRWFPCAVRHRAARSVGRWTSSPVDPQPNPLMSAMNPNLTDRRSLLSCARLGALLALSSVAAAQVCTVRSEQKISAMAGGLGAGLEAGDEFGWSMCALGDLDGDGVGDLAVGAHLDDEGSFGQGAVWILFLEDDGTVKAKQKISATAGGFGGTLDTGDFLGSSVANLGDLDGDGVGDLAVGAAGDADGGSQRGAVWILFLETDGTVKAEQKISATAGGFAGVLHNGDLFGWSLSSLGDLDGDGIGDLAAGAVLDDDGGVDQGAVWILFLDANGTVKSERKISTLAGGFGGDLDPADNFGCSVAALGDLDGDGTGDLAVGASEDDDGDNAQGAVWILFLDADGTVRAEQKVSATAGGFGGDLDAIDEFGWSLCALGDLDGDGIGDLAVGARLDDDGGNNLGAVWILALDDDGRVKSEWKISATAGGFGGHLDANDVLGSSLAALGDLDGDGLADLAVGSKWDDDGATNAGAAWILFLGEDTTAPVISCPAVVSVIDSKGGPPGDFAFFTVTASDNCDPAPSIVCTPPSGSYFPRGTTVVTCTATDASGNMSLRTFPVVVMPSVRVR